jgi:hypothetical protein
MVCMSGMHVSIMPAIFVLARNQRMLEDWQVIDRVGRLPLQ